MLARKIDDPAPGQQSLGVLDISVGRNAFGSQVDSAEAALDWSTLGGDVLPVKTAFIRAPRVSSVGANVEVTARYRGEVVGVRQGKIIGISFHPELTGDTTVHEELLGLA